MTSNKNNKNKTNNNKKRSGRKVKVGHTTTTLFFIQPFQ
jgi:hypothetical protein